MMPPVNRRMFQYLRSAFFRKKNLQIRMLVTRYAGNAPEHNVAHVMRPVLRIDLCTLCVKRDAHRNASCNAVEKEQTRAVKEYLNRLRRSGDALFQVLPLHVLRTALTQRNTTASRQLRSNLDPDFVLVHLLR